MCVTTEPSEMAKTTVYAAEVRGDDGEAEQVIGYENTAKTGRPNAMILPLPAAGRPTPVDMTACPNLLKDLRDLTTPRSRGGFIGAARGGVEIIDVGSYTVLLTQDTRLLPDELGRVPEAKRPKPHFGIYHAYPEFYPGWWFALCCWNGEMEAEPLVWRFKSVRPDYLFLPGLDGHDGLVPRVDDRVERDHHLIWGSALRGDPGGSRTDSVRARLPEPYASLVPSFVDGRKVSDSTPNGDWWVLLDAMRKGPALERPIGLV